MRSAGYGHWRWRMTRRADVARVESFLRTAADSCMSACARFLGRKQGDHAWFLAETGSEVSALIVHYNRILFPVFLGRRDVPLPGFMRRFLGRMPLHAVHGPREDAERLEVLIRPLGYESVHRVEFDLMTLDCAPAPRSLLAGPAGLVVRQPRAGDSGEIEALFQLHAAYEREEVLPPGAAFNAAASRLSFTQTLGREYLLAAELGGRIVGKINTNAAAFSRYQIGGVYVHPAYRGRGIATRMTAALSQYLIALGGGINLFVKKGNPAARSAYLRAGFKTAGDYRITYY